MLSNLYSNSLLVIISFLGVISINNGQNILIDSSKVKEDTIYLTLDDDLLINDYNIDSLLTGLNFNSGQDYKNTKNNMVALRKSCKSSYNKIISSSEKLQFLDSIMNVFVFNLLNEIIPYWYGTVWDFEGHTDIPNKGEIACGYFVSTTLRDMGLNLNRYRLAQADPLTEAMTIAIKKRYISIFSMDNYSNVRDILQSLDDGLYFVGLDYHVGYLYKKDYQFYFIHSNYLDRKVMIEKAEFSQAFYSNYYYLTKISNNHDIALAWINQTPLKIILKSD